MKSEAASMNIFENVSGSWKSRLLII